MATLKDIAKQCGTSVATVSYVLNGRGAEMRISPATRQLVEAAARELGYTAAPAARPPKIAVFWPQRSVEAMLPAVVNGLNAALAREPSPVELLLRPYDGNHLSLDESLWTPRSYDAAIIVSAGSADLEALTRRRAEVPTVLLNRMLPGYSWVSVDHREAGRLAGELAVRSGGEDVALVLNPLPFVGMDLRGQGFCAACAAHGVSMADRILSCGNNIDGGYELGVRLARSGQLPRVIACMYDLAAFGLVRALVEAHVPVGDTVQVLAAGFSFSQFFARCTPPLTVVDLRIEEAPERAVRVAVDLAGQRLAAPVEQTLPPLVIYRDSCPCPTGEARAAALAGELDAT